MVLLPAFSVAQSDAVGSAVSRLQTGDSAGAEQILRDELKAQPADAIAAGVLAVVLDQQQHYDEAGRMFARALVGDAGDPALWNNYGNHLLAVGKRDEARGAYRRVLGIDAGHVNARIQLASLALRQKQTTEALRYLAGIQAGADPGLNRQLGEALAGTGQYGRAEKAFRAVVDADPGNMDALYEMGLAASHAGHWDVAERSLTQVLDRAPENAAALYDLAVIKQQMKQQDAAMDLAARASRLQPGNSEAHGLLAQLLTEQGYFADAIGAWGEYLSLAPGDEVGRRERAFAQTAVGRDPVSAMAELRSYAQKHPGDAMGHYELALAIANQDSGEAKRQLDLALVLNPKFANAQVARGLWFSKHGEDELALADYRAAAAREGDNPKVLDRLGEAYAATGNLHAALPLFAKAAELAPEDATVVLHLARARLKQGDTVQAQDLFARVRRLRAAAPLQKQSEGLLDFLRLTPAERLTQYKAGVEKTATAQPENAEAQSRYLALLAADGASAQLEPVCQQLSRLGADAALYATAARAVLSADNPSLSCASSLLASGLKQDAQNQDLLALRSLAAELLPGPPPQTVEARNTHVR